MCIYIYIHTYIYIYTYVHTCARAMQYAMFMNKDLPTAVAHWSFQQISWFRGKFLSVTPDAHDISSSQARAPRAVPKGNLTCGYGSFHRCGYPQNGWFVNVCKGNPY